MLEHPKHPPSPDPPLQSEWCHGHPRSDRCDKDTIISNNSANLSGNVISVCLSKICAYGLEVQLDPTYTMYCSIYDEGYLESVTSIPPTNQNSFTTPVKQYSKRILSLNQPLLKRATQDSTIGEKL